MSLTSARKHRLATEQRGFSDAPINFNWPRPRRPLAERLEKRAARTALGKEDNTTPPQAKQTEPQGLFPGEVLILNTPLPRKLQRRKIPVWVIPAVVVIASFIASALLWHWYGTLPRP